MEKHYKLVDIELILLKIIIWKNDDFDIAKVDQEKNLNSLRNWRYKHANDPVIRLADNVVLFLLSGKR